MFHGYVKLLELATNLFTMYRWNNMPTLVRTNEAENAFVSAQYCLLMSEMSALHGLKLDKNKLFQRLVLKELPKCLLSDISVDTKILIKSLSPEKWTAVFSKTVEEVVQYFPSKRRGEFFVSMVDTKDSSIEGRIIQTGDLLSAMLEAEIHGRYFPDFFARPLKDLEKRLENFKDFQPYSLIANSDWIKRYSDALVVLLRAVRWNRLNRNVPTTVAGHSFYVTLTSYILSSMEIENGGKIDPVEVIKRALLHDIPESMTGDIITPTKKKVPGFEEVISQVEEQMVSGNLLRGMPDELVKELKSRMLDPFATTEGELVRAADQFAATVECLMEIRSGNTQPAFRDALHRMLDDLSSSTFESVRFVTESFRWGLDWAGR
ncbi:MAG TPA: HD domain-containing protein [Mesotoga infera]|uniref:Metal dependent phosphohydrolase n=1 Tax=Mesotoga infera TaxID=1236046 RepID=A0A7Z7LD12_9BACT|nr:YfbR-like 5'-deoxynucleotidase [Mesotoga infera]MBP8659502.1 HD domain-containing protein [Mesotoga sp.]MDY0111232.1 HD domain-containing protein [Candidatus Krumholzibacteria bacterium]NLI05552.1 HD domain-containing protein [Thermotogaceae bacterium]SSC11824.1 Metal dependent phosphohydrolase [Mesotoga infera]HNS66149.1 HD domain-containing protein [Mesotoga infera]